jgi:hypothetical protein
MTSPTWRALGQVVLVYFAVGGAAVTAQDTQPGRATFAEMIVYEGKISVPVTLTSCAFRKSYPDVPLKKAPAQERDRTPQPGAPRHRLIGKLALHRRKQPTIENGLVLAAVNLAPVDDLADIKAVLETRERPYAKPSATDGATVRQPPRLAADPPADYLLLRDDLTSLIPDRATPFLIETNVCPDT